MAVKNITYFVKGKKKKLEVKLCDTILKKFTGLMFRKNSPPLLFVFSKEKKLSIHSWFCKPFTAIWLDDKMHAIQVLEINNWRTRIAGKGRYLLEIPAPLNNGKSSSRNQ